MNLDLGVALREPDGQIAELLLLEVVLEAGQQEDPPVVHLYGTKI